MESSPSPEKSPPSFKWHLLTSSTVILIVALLYGVVPGTTLPYLFNFEANSTELRNVFRATMGLYLGFAGYWLYAVIHPAHRRNATLSCIIFMGGLAVGRVISTVADGFSAPFTFGLLLEIFFLAWGIRNLQKK